MSSVLLLVLTAVATIAMATRRHRPALLPVRTQRGSRRAGHRPG